MSLFYVKKNETHGLWVSAFLASSRSHKYLKWNQKGSSRSHKYLKWNQKGIFIKLHFLS